MNANSENKHVCQTEKPAATPAAKGQAGQSGDLVTLNFVAVDLDAVVDHIDFAEAARELMPQQREVVGTILGR